MAKTNQSDFNCQLYVSARGHLTTMLPTESGPKRVITFASVDYDQLIEPSFRNLLATLQSMPRPLTVAQVS